MISLSLKTNGKDVLDSYDEENPTLGEVALILLRLEQIKSFLVNKEFENKFRVSKT